MGEHEIQWKAEGIFHDDIKLYNSSRSVDVVTSRLDVAAEMVMTVGFPGAQISGTVRLVT